MPRTRSLAWAELKIGLISLFAIIMAVVLILLLSGEGGFFWQRYPVKTVFDNIAGLKSGAPVRVAGMEVGSVTDVQFMGDQVEVVMQVRRDMRPRITDRSVASLGSVSLLGEAAVDITASSEGTPVPDGGYVMSGRAAGSIADVTTQATAGIERLNALLLDVQEGRGTIGRLFTDDGLYSDLAALVGAAEEVARGVGEGRGTLGRLMTDPAAAEALEGSMRNLEEITARVRAGEGSLGQLLADDALGQSLTSTAENFAAITDRLNSGDGSAGALLSERELYDRLNSMAARFEEVSAALAKGEGTAGRILQDQQLYENMNSAVSEMQALLADIRADPRKFLTVRVSIF